MSKYDGPSGELDARADAVHLVALAIADDPRAGELVAAYEADDTSALVTATVDVLVAIAVSGGSAPETVEAIRLDLLERSLRE